MLGGGAQRSPDTQGATVGSGAVVVPPTLGVACAADSWLPSGRRWEGNEASAAQVRCLLELAGRGEVDMNVALMTSLEDHSSAPHL